MSATTAQKPALLDCGHAPTTTDGVGTGVAYAPDGTSMCYACADASEKLALSQLAEGQRFGAYLSSNGRHITTWSGGILANVTSHGTARTGWYGSTVHYIRATGADGAEFYGRNGGPGMFIALTRKKASK